MMFTAASFFLLAAPLLVSAGCIPATPPSTAGWVYAKGDVVHKGEHSTLCHNDELHQGDKWQWNNLANGPCQLFMYGDTQCTGKDGLNFKTRGNEDHGHAHTNHLAWQVKC